MKSTPLSLTLTFTFAAISLATPVVHNAPLGFPRVLDWRPFTLNPFVVLTEIGTVPQLTDVIYFGDVVTSTTAAVAAMPTTLEKRVVGRSVSASVSAPATTAIAVVGGSGGGNAATASNSGGAKQAETKKDTRPIKSYSGWNYRCVGPDC